MSTVREKVRENFFFQGQGILKFVREFRNLSKSQEKVREFLNNQSINDKNFKNKGLKAVSSCLAIIIILMIIKILLLLLLLIRIRIKILIIIVIQWTLFTKATFVPKHFDVELNLLL